LEFFDAIDNIVEPFWDIEGSQNGFGRHCPEFCVNGNRIQL